MPRIAGVDVPGDKRMEISLRYIYGIGPSIAGEILKEAGIDAGVRAKDLNEDEIGQPPFLGINENPLTTTTTKTFHCGITVRESGTLSERWFNDNVALRVDITQLVIRIDACESV